MAESNFIGIDIGTTAAKGILLSSDGQTLAGAAAEYPLLLPQPGWAEQDPDLWVLATVRVLSELVAKAPDAMGHVAALSLSGQMHGLVCLDERGQVLRPAILWCDIRTTRQCRQIEEALGGHSGVVGHTLNAALEGFTLPKLLWVKENQPDIYARIRTVLLPKDYVGYRLTGTLGTEMTDAAGTMLLDIRKSSWSSEVAAAVGIDPQILPAVYLSTAIAGTITGEIAGAAGIKQGVPVAFGGADNACAAVGTGATRPGTAVISIGTSGTVVVPMESPLYDLQGRTHTFNHAVPGLWYIMGVMQAAGLSLKWIKDNFFQLENTVATESKQNVYDILSAEADAVPPGADGLLWLPYLNGERTPHMDPDARAVLFGITPRHSKSHVLRAVMEGVGFGLRDSFSIINSLGAPVEELRITGGGARSAVWRQIIANILQRPLVGVQNNEGPAFGAAIIAGAAVGAFASIPEATDRLIQVADATVPDRSAAAVYDDAYHRYRSLYAALREEFRRS